MSKPIAQILADVEAAAGSATSVHIVASGLSGGKPLNMNLKLANGIGGSGSLTENGLSFQLIRVGTNAYFEGGPSFWRHVVGASSSAALIQLFAGRWIEASATSGPLAPLTMITDMKSFFTGLLHSHGKLALGSTTTIDGQTAFGLVDTTQGGTLYVAATGKPYPLAVTPKNGSDGGSITFEAWDQPAHVTAPKNPLDFTKLLAGK
jgi:hypothetical protein